jgi:hypothetical protein
MELLPIDRFAQANLWKEIMLAMQRLPQIAMEYDIGKIFAWTAQLGGLKNISQFKIQMGSPAWLQQQAQMGNMVPLGGAANGPPPAAAANMAEPKQIGGVGPTG